VSWRRHQGGGETRPKVAEKKEWVATVEVTGMVGGSACRKDHLGEEKKGIQGILRGEGEGREQSKRQGGKSRWS